MKKFIYLIVLALILGLVLTGCSLLSNISQVPAIEQSGISYLTKHTADDPQVIDLLAGQTTKVGEVKVWNDVVNLYVKYVITDPDWCLTETHLQVATSLAGIPKTKTGNPIPGKFEENDEHDCVTEVLYTYNLGDRGWDVDEDLYIAAHAVVVKGYSLTLYSNTDTQTAGWFERDSYTGDVTANYALTASNYSGIGVWANSADISSPNSAWYDEILLADAIWISSTDGFEGNAGYDQWRLFKEEFNIPEWAINIMGSIQFTADNAVATYLGSNVIAETSYVYAIGPAFPRDDSVRHFKYLYGPYDFFPQTGLNSLNFVVRNYYSTSGSNPTGLLYRVEISYDQSETAWGAGTRFVQKGNWATYFEYTVQGWKLLETIEVPAIGTKMTSINSLAEDHLYKFEASGTCNWRVPPHSSGYLGDAEYWLRNDSYGTGWTHMGIWSLSMWDGAPVEVEWGAYNIDHKYTFEYTPSADGKVTFFFNDDGYSDNSGFLTVKIYEWK